MRVQTEQPRQWNTGDALAPQDLNHLYLYTQDVISDLAQRRWAKAPLSLPFVRDVATPYTQALGVEERRYRFTCPMSCVVERAFINARMTATVAPATWTISKAAGGAVPTGVSTPWLSTQGALVGSPGVPSTDGIIASVSDVTKVNNDRFVLDAGSEYIIELGGNTYSLDRGDLIMHCATDRWQSTGALTYPTFSPTLFSDASTRDAAVVVANNSAAATEIARFAKTANAGMTPRLFVRHGFTNATSANVLTFTIPRVAAARGEATIVRLYLYVVTAGATTITATLRNQAGVTQATVTANVVGTQLSVDSGVLAIDIGGAAAHIVANDFSLTLANSSATNCLKAQVLMWTAWS